MWHPNWPWQLWNHGEIYFKTNSVLSWPSKRRRCKMQNSVVVFSAKNWKKTKIPSSTTISTCQIWHESDITESPKWPMAKSNHGQIYFKTNSVLSWPSNRRRCKQWSEGRTSSNDFYFTQRTSIGLQISNQQGAIKMIKRIKWHHVEHHLLRWSRKGAINTYISSAHVRDGAWGPIGPGGPVGEPWRWEEVDYLFLYRNVGRFENPEDIICLPPIWLE